MLEAAIPAVPLALRGLWKREVLRRPDEADDRTTRVYWLQTERWHVDLRIPAERPDFSDIGCLEDCTDVQLAFIAGQEAFCGITRAEGETCTWCRLFDLKPGTVLDVGRLEWAGDRLIEHGVGADYLEEWVRCESANASSDAAAEPTSASRHADGTLMLTAGDFRMTVAPRSDAGGFFDPYEPVEALDRRARLWRASLAFALWQRSGSSWSVILSTHPFLEGRRIEAELDGAEEYPGQTVHPTSLPAEAKSRCA